MVNASLNKQFLRRAFELPAAGFDRWLQSEIRRTLLASFARVANARRDIQTFRHALVPGVSKKGFMSPITVRPGSARGKRGTVSAADKDIVVYVPEHRLARARPVKHIVWLGIAVKIAHRHQCPAAGQGRAVSAADKDIVVHVPDHRLPRAPVVEHEIWFAVVVEVCIWGTARNSPCEVKLAD